MTLIMENWHDSYNKERGAMTLCSLWWNKTKMPWGKKPKLMPLPVTASSSHRNISLNTRINSELQFFLLTETTRIILNTAWLHPGWNWLVESEIASARMLILFSEDSSTTLQHRTIRLVSLSQILYLYFPLQLMLFQWQYKKQILWSWCI